MPDTLRLAVLIDADNASPAVIGDILAEVASFGLASVKRVYGDFTSPNLSGWRNVLAEFGIQPIQQFRNTVGKNASDSALIIDAMDLLHTRQLGGFCLVSSDSDFTRLATRIREDGLSVFGFGQQKTPKSFIAACDQFTYTEIFQKTSPATALAATQAPVPLRDFRADAEFSAALEQSVQASANEDGWSSLAAVGNHLRKVLPDFDPRNYGFQKLSDLVKEIPRLELNRRTANSGQQIVYIRIRGNGAGGGHQ